MKKKVDVKLNVPPLTEKNKGPWTLFWDMHSGGGQKENWNHIYIQAKEEEARSIFYARFGHNPDRVTCTCCGSDYAVQESETLAEVSGYHRNCEYVVVGRGKSKRGVYVETDATSYSGSVKKHIPFETFLKKKMDSSGSVKIIFAKDIKPGERTKYIPEQGYVWQD